MKLIKDPNLFQKIKEFLTSYLPVIRAKSLNTISAYKMTINLYLSYIKTRYNKSFSEIVITDFNHKNILAFLEWSKAERKNCISTRNQRLVHIRQFCKYLMGSDMISFSEYSLIQRIAKEVDPKKDELIFLTIEDMKLILAQPDLSKNSGIRDKFFLALLYDSGCRDQELLDLQLKDFIVTRDNAELHVIGKGRKYRVTPISKDVLKLFEGYCKIYHPDMKKESLLFYTTRNGITTKMSADNVARFMNKYERQVKQIKSDLPHLHPHLFRHTRAMHLYMAGMPLPLISEWLGHSQLETTTIYARATTEMKRKAVEKVSSKENSVFNTDKIFKYADNNEVIKKLYGLT